MIVLIYLDIGLKNLESLPKSRTLLSMVSYEHCEEFFCLALSLYQVRKKLEVVCKVTNKFQFVWQETRHY